MDYYQVYSGDHGVLHCPFFTFNSKVYSQILSSLTAEGYKYREREKAIQAPPQESLFFKDSKIIKISKTKINADLTRFEVSLTTPYPKTK